MSNNISPPPIKEQMFHTTGILSRVWIMFFQEVQTKLKKALDNGPENAELMASVMDSPKDVSRLLAEVDALIRFAEGKVDYSKQLSDLERLVAVIEKSKVIPSEFNELSIRTSFDTPQTIAKVSLWDDVRIIPGALVFAGSSDPTLQDWRPGGAGATFKVWKFDSGDEAFFTCQLPHGYKEGSDIYPHVHWTPGGRGTTEGTATVGWKIDYSWASVDGVFAASSTVDCTDACKSANDQHLISPETAISGAGKTMSSMLVCRVYRDGGTWAGTLANAPALLEVDIHYQLDGLGSRTTDLK